MEEEEVEKEEEAVGGGGRRWEEEPNRPDTCSLAINRLCTTPTGRRVVHRAVYIQLQQAPGYIAKRLVIT